MTPLVLDFDVFDAFFATVLRTRGGTSRIRSFLIDSVVYARRTQMREVSEADLIEEHRTHELRLDLSSGTVLCL